MKLVVGLGNPGEKYKNNRHNAGFIIIDELALKWNLPWEYNKKFDAEIARNDKVVLIKPQTFMNDSGEAVSRALQYFGIDSSGLTVVHDDIDLEALQFKVSCNSSSAGHRGVQNIIDGIGTQDFTRLRVGIGRPPQRTLQQFEEVASGETGPRDENAVESAITSSYVEKYVLQDFPSDQLEIVKKTGIEHLLSSLNL